jgi:SAM-dependent methyltransferase
MEVGTGWYPVVPIGVWFCGADRNLTYDLNRYLSPRVTSRALEWMVTHVEELADTLSDLAPRDLIKEKLDLVRRFKRRPLGLLEQANIQYIAPRDAGSTGLAEDSVDIHVSLFTFEHIPRNDLRAILREAARVLRPGGLAIHRVDPKDHFSDIDASITKVNFLRFTEREWRKHFGNRYAYQNRLHDPEFRALFDESGFELLDCGFKIDERALEALTNGFPLAPPFNEQSFEDLCRCTLYYVATPLRFR